MKNYLNFKSFFFPFLKLLQFFNFSFLIFLLVYEILSLGLVGVEAAVREGESIFFQDQVRVQRRVTGNSEIERVNITRASYKELEKIEILPESAFVNTGRDRLGGGSYSSGIFRRVIPEIPGVPSVEELWIGKADYRRTVEETESVSVGEVLASRIYEAYGVMRPKTTLSRQKLTNTGNPEDEGQRYAVHVMAKLIEGFYPYSHQVEFNRQRPNPNGKIYHPQIAPEGDTGVELKEEGLGRASAVAAWIRHWDYMGASSTNMGYQIVELPDGRRIAQSIVIDSGGAFDINPAIQVPPRHLRFAPQQDTDLIPFEDLPLTSRQEFLMTLHAILTTEEPNEEERKVLNERKIARLFMTEGAEYFVLRDQRSVEGLTTLLLERQRQLSVEYASELAQTKEAYLEMRARHQAELEAEKKRQERIQREIADQHEREAQHQAEQQARLRHQVEEIGRVLGVQASLPVDPLRIEEEAIALFKRDHPQDQARVRSQVREIIKREGPHRYTAALGLFLKGSASDQLLSRSLLQTLIAERDSPQRLEAAFALFFKGNAEDQRLSRAILLEVLGDPRDPSRYEAAQILFDRGGEGDRRKSRALVREAVQHQHSSFFKSALSLFENGTPEDQELARRALEPLMGDPRYPNYDEIARAFFFCGTAADQWRFGNVVRTIAKDITHPRQDEAALALFFRGTPEDKAINRPILSQVAQDEGHPRQDLAACILFWNGTPDDQRHARPILHSIMRNTSHPRRDWAARALFEAGTEEDQRISRDVLRLIASTETHPRRELAAWALFERGTEEDQTFVKPFVEGIASDREHSFQDVALHGLFSKGSDKDENRARFREDLRLLAQHEGHPRQYEAAKLLVEKGNGEDKEIGKGIISRITQQEGHPLQESAQSFLKDQSSCLVM